MAKRPEPKKDDEVTITVRVPRDLHAQATEAARLDDRSLNVYVLRAIRAQVERDGAAKGKR